MATTPLTEAPVPALDYPDLIRRAWAGERVTIHDGIHPDLVLQKQIDWAEAESKRQELRRKSLDIGPKLSATLARIEAEPLDPSMGATLERARRLELEREEPARMGAEAADAVEEVMREWRPIWAAEWD